MFKQNTQAGRLLEHFNNGGSITSLEAYQTLGITQLAARLCDIESAGVEIDREWITVNNRFGEDCRVVKYRLKNELAVAA